MTPGHIALLGDSILDNAAYSGGEDVAKHLRALVPARWQLSLLARDGSTTTDLARQVASVPSTATHLIVAIGGNDALQNRDLLARPVASTTETLMLFRERVSVFEERYRAAIHNAASLKVPLTVCTIYNGNLEPSEARVARIALMTFNDVILRVAFERALSVLDLRLICTEPADYANPIEPSSQGGRKIARAIAAMLGLTDRASIASHVYSTG